MRWGGRCVRASARTCSRVAHGCQEAENSTQLLGVKQRDFPGGVPWLRLHAASAGGLGLIPGQGAISRMPQLRPGRAK